MSIVWQFHFVVFNCGGRHGVEELTLLQLMPNLLLPVVQEMVINNFGSNSGLWLFCSETLEFVNIFPCENKHPVRAAGPWRIMT